MATLDDLKNLANALKNGVSEQYKQGAPYRNALAQALQGNLQPADVLFNTPQPVNDQQAVDVAMGFSPMALGTIGKVASKLTPFEQNHLIAQKNAAEMLGLPHNNTAMDRARAMGYTTPVWHGTNADIQAFDMGKVGSNIALPLDAPRGIYTAKSPELASRYSNGEGANVMPLLQNADDAILNNSKIMATDNPSSLRSMFAAFDPAKRNQSDIMGNASPELLALIAAGAGGGLLATKK